MSDAPTPGTYALSYPGRGLAVLAAHWPVPPDDLPQFCSCANLDCPRPAQHPIGTLTAADATRDPAQLARWWLAHPTANPAIVTDEARIGAIELYHPAKPEHLLRLLNVHRADQSPIIYGGHGRALFLVKPTPGSSDHQPTPSFSADNGEVTCLAPGSLVLPPSRLMHGGRLRWMRRLDHTTRLPDAEPLLALLTDLLESGTLDDLHSLLTM